MWRRTRDTERVSNVPQAAIVKEEEAKAQAKADAAKAIKDECTADLAEVGWVANKRTRTRVPVSFVCHTSVNKAAFTN